MDIDQLLAAVNASGGGGVLSSSQRTALYNLGNGLAYSQFTT